VFIVVLHRKRKNGLLPEYEKIHICPLEEMAYRILWTMDEHSSETTRATTILRFGAITLFSLYFFSALRSPSTFHLIDSVDLIFHEAGHTLLFWAPQVITVLGGSLMQILVPLIFVLYFVLRKSFFSSALLLFWLGYSIVNVSIYAGDAFARQLPLLGGDGVIHDWMYLSAELGLGKNVLVLAKFLSSLGLITMLGGLGWSLFLTLKPLRET
jgi:hypothetical protein